MNKIEGKTILVVEDVDSNYKLVEVVLEKNGANIIHTLYGKEAIKICKENKDIDIVLMDIHLPDIDGYEATTKIKEIIPDLPIIAVTAYALSGDREKAFAVGCNDYIPKPYKPITLIEKVIEQLDLIDN